MPKRCSSCKETLSESDFYSNKRKKDGLCNECKKCHYARNRAYYTAHAEHTAAYRKQYYSEHKTDEKTRMKEYREERKDLIRVPRGSRTPKRDSEAYKRRADNRLQVKYGITLEEYTTRHEQQGGKCAICNQPSSNGYTLAVDHNHTSGVIRELLCHRCNTSLGLVNEDSTILHAMIDYLKRHTV